MRWIGGSREKSRSVAEAAARSGDWDRALKIWREINASDAANGLSHLGEARAALALGRAFQSERALRRSVVADPENIEPWQLLLQILRVEDRTLDASRTGWEAYEQRAPDSRPAVLKELTLALLAELPDDDVRRTLRRWIDADSSDLDARIALVERMASQPRAADPDRVILLTELEMVVTAPPGPHQGAGGACDRPGRRGRARAWTHDSGRLALERSRFSLLASARRWDLEYDNQPEAAAAAFHTVLTEIPQDWRTWYRLARALHTLGRDGESRQAAETVSRIRGALDPLVLRPLLDESLGHLSEPAPLEEIAGLCKRVGLARLGEAWHREAQRVERGSDASGGNSK